MINKGIFYIVIILFIFIGIFYFAVDKPVIKAESSDIIAGKWSLPLGTDHLIKLDGEWEYFENQIVPPNYEQPSNGYVDVPYMWRYNGLATFKMTLFSEVERNDLGIKSPLVYAAFDIYLNEEWIASNGIPSMNAHDEKIVRKPLVVPIHLKKGENEIIITVSNHKLYKGGIARSIIIGDFDTLKNYRDLQLVFDTFFAGGYFAFAIVFCVLYFIRWKDRTVGYFSLVCLGVFLKVLVSNQMPINFLVQDFSWEIGNRIETGFNMVVLPLIILQITEMFKDIFSERLAKGITWGILAALILVSLTSHKIYDSLMGIWIGIVVVLTVYVIIKLFKNYKYYDKEIVVLSIGLFIVFCFGIQDLISYYVYSSVANKIQYSIFMYIIYLASLIVANIYNRHHHSIKKVKEMEIKVRELQEEKEALLEKINQHV